MSENQHPVFVSSTYEDLQHHRALVLETLQRLDVPIKAMELFGAHPGSPKDVALNAVRDSHVYIGILGMRYGTIDPGSGLSITHLEYNEAQRLRLPSLIYIIDDTEHPVLPRHVETGPGSDSLKLLKEELKQKHTVSFFTAPHELAWKIALDLPRLLEDIEAGLERAEVELVRTPTPAARPTVDIAIDMDVTGNDARLSRGVDTKNSGKIVGSSQLDIDVIVCPPGVDSEYGLFGYGFDLVFDPAVVAVVREDQGFLLAQAPGSNIYSVSGSRPSREGRFTSAAIDTGLPVAVEPKGTSEIGPGVLARITLEGVAPGTSQLVLDNVGLLDKNNEGMPLATVMNATVTVEEERS